MLLLMKLYPHTGHQYRYTYNLIVLGHLQSCDATNYIYSNTFLRTMLEYLYSNPLIENKNTEINENNPQVQSLYMNQPSTNFQKNTFAIISFRNPNTHHTNTINIPNQTKQQSLNKFKYTPQAFGNCFERLDFNLSGPFANLKNYCDRDVNQKYKLSGALCAFLSFQNASRVIGP